MNTEQHTNDAIACLNKAMVLLNEVKLELNIASEHLRLADNPEEVQYVLTLKSKIIDVHYLTKEEIELLQEGLESD